jgi:hypothetical protein
VFDRFERDDSYVADSAKQSNDIDLERQARHRPPEDKSADMKQLPDKDYTNSSAAPEHNPWNMAPSMDTLRKVGIAVVVVVLPIAIWHRRIRPTTSA